MHYKHFSVEERENIQLGLWRKESIRVMAKRLGRSPSSVSREIRKNLPKEVRRYTPRLAEARAVEKRTRKKGRVRDGTVRGYVIAQLKNGYSPEQVAGRMKRDGIGTLSYETIYRFVYEEGGDLRRFLKRRHRARQKKGARKWQRLPNPNKPSIDARPAIVERRSRMGDWEGDLVVSRASSVALMTLVERKSGYVCIEKVPRKTAEAVSRAMSRRLQLGPTRTLTLDNGSENNHWKGIERETGIRVFFAHPYHSWERGTNENTNGLIRWYLPKGTDFKTVSKEKIREVEYALNTRPRKRLNYRTPLEVWSVALEG